MFINIVMVSRRRLFAERGEEIIRNKDVPARSGLMRGACGEDHQGASLERLRRGRRQGGVGGMEGKETEINLRQRSNSICLDKDLLSRRTYPFHLCKCLQSSSNFHGRVENREGGGDGVCGGVRKKEKQLKLTVKKKRGNQAATTSSLQVRATVKAEAEGFHVVTEQHAQPSGTAVPLVSTLSRPPTHQQHTWHATIKHTEEHGGQHISFPHPTPPPSPHY